MRTSKRVAAVLLALVAASCARAQDVTAIKAEKVYTISGAEITNGVVLVRGAKIEAVGANLSIPAGAKVIEAKVVMPGMVEAHTARAMDAPNENVPVVPFVNTADGLDPVNVALEDALRDGITTIHVIQGNNTVVGGTGVIIRPVGATVEAVTVKRPSAMKLSLSPGGGRNRMAQINELRKAFDDYEVYAEGLAERRAEQKKRGEPQEEIDPRQASMRDLVEGKLTAFIYCPRDAEVLRAIELIDARKLKAVLVLGPDCYRSAPAIARKGLSVILDSQLTSWETDEEHDRQIRHNIPAIFQRAGVKYALQVSQSGYGSRYLWFQAAQAVSQGVPVAAALRSITLSPAEMIGMGSRVGSIEPGKDANLLLLTGSPLATSTWVDSVLVEGKVVYERKSDGRLQRMLTGKDNP